MAIHLGPRQRVIARIAGFAVLGLVTFVMALQLSLPIDRAKDKLIETLSPTFDVQIGGVERGWMPGRVYLTAVSLRTRPSKVGEPVTTIYIEKVKLDVGLLALLHRNISVDFDAKLGAGSLAGNYTALAWGRGGFSAHVEGQNVSGTSLPIRMALGLPMTGKLDLSADLTLPDEANKSGVVAANWTKAEGSFDLECPSGCTFGDGKTKLKPILNNQRNQAMVGDGIDFGKVTLDSLVAKAEIKNGKLELTKFQTTSKDGELHIDFTMKLEPSIMDSLVTGCLRFKGSEGLATREPKTFAALTTTGAEIRADGLFHIKLAETLRNMKRLNMECGPNAPQAGTGEFAAPPHGPPPRPVLTVPPPEPPRPVEPPPRAEIPHPIAGSAVPPSAPAGSGFAPAPGPAPAAGSGSAPPPMEGAPGSGSAPAEEQAGSGSNEQALPR